MWAAWVTILIHGVDSDLVSVYDVNMPRKNSNHDLDSTDLRLIAELEVDPRQRYINLAAMLGIDQTTVKRRINRLLKARVISFQSVLNAAAVGYYSAQLGLNVERGHIEQVVNELSRHTLVNSSITSGRYDIVGIVHYRDPEMLFDFVSGKLGKIPGLTGIEVFPVLKVMKYSFNLLGNADYRPLPSKMARQLDEYDWNILIELEKNPRITNTHLAKKLGISAQATSGKLKRILDEGAARINCLVSPPMVGYELNLGMFLKAQPKSIMDVAEWLIANRSIKIVVAVSGRYDLIAYAVFKSPNGMVDFLINELGKHPGVTSTETIHIKALSTPLSALNAKAFLQA
jgi:DNA-binding Lrp family transcriptional regulator